MDKLIACFSLCLVLFAGCKKDNPASQQPAPGCRLRSYETSSSVTTYEYDNAGNFIKAIYASGDYTTYTKGNGTLTITDYDASGSIETETVATINSFGYITNWKDEFGNTYKAKYNGEGYITELEKTDKNNKLQYREHNTYAGGNLIEIASWRWVVSSYDSSHVIYQYHFDKENKGNIPIESSPLWRFFCKPNKNLVFKMYTDYDTYTYTYVLKDGLPTHSTVLYSTGGSTYKYSFTCN